MLLPGTRRPSETTVSQTGSPTTLPSSTRTVKGTDAAFYSEHDLLHVTTHLATDGLLEELRRSQEEEQDGEEETDVPRVTDMENGTMHRDAVGGKKCSKMSPIGTGNASRYPQYPAEIECSALWRR